MLGPGLFMAGAAIGGGEWLTGPVITARYGGGLLWLATLSILGQALYNVEVSRYTLYTGEPIFAGKLRTFPGPRFWVPVYLIFDSASFFPYLAASGAIPLLALFRGEIPDPAGNPSDEFAIRCLSIGIFLAAMVPLVFGGKIYNSIRVLMTTKIVLVMGFLLLLAAMFSTLETWAEITSGFFKFGNVPIRRSEDVNLNGLLDQGEDWDHDGKLDVEEPSLQLHSLIPTATVNRMPPTPTRMGSLIQWLPLLEPDPPSGPISTATEQLTRVWLSTPPVTAIPIGRSPSTGMGTAG